MYQVETKSGLCKRIIPCLDVAGNRTVKGLKFQNLRDVGDPLELALEYQRQGADELMFLDISATKEERQTVFALIKEVAHVLSIPFTVGGGIRNLDDVKRLLDCGADKVSINSAAVARPELIEEIAVSCGSQCCVVAIDARAKTARDQVHQVHQVDQLAQLDQSAETARGWEVIVAGGSRPTGLDALTWGKQCVERGAGEILLTSFDADGTLAGFDLPMVRAFAPLPIPIIASGGARDPQSFVEVFATGQGPAADAALAASIFHDRKFTVGQVKETLANSGIEVRLC